MEWSSPRLICIAGDFTRYDEHAVQQINRNIELIRYRKYGDEFLLLDLVNSVQASSATPETNHNKGAVGTKYKSVTQYLESAPEELKDRFESLKAFLLALGDDVQIKTLKLYFAFKRIKNFACVEIHPQTNTLLTYTKVDPESLDLEAWGKDFVRNVRGIGHYGTGDLEIRIKSDEELERAKDLLVKSYEVS